MNFSGVCSVWASVEGMRQEAFARDLVEPLLRVLFEPFLFFCMKLSPTFLWFYAFVGPLWTPVLSELSATEKPAAPPEPVPQAQAGQLDPGWPREITRNGIRFVYYQPQVDEWKNFRELRARLAFVLTPKGGKPVAGVEELQGRTTANVETRTVFIDNIEITAVRFPALSGEEETAMETLLKSTFPGKPLTVSLDRLITSVQAGQEKEKPAPVKTEPPPILVSTEPALLLTVQSDPVLAPIQGISLKFVLNANWDLFFDPAESKYYLLVDKLWLTASALDGPWSAVSKLPSDFNNFPDTEGWDHVKKTIPAAVAGKAPKVFFTKEAAELIVFAGTPVYKKIEGTELSFATNTDDWVFTDSADGQIYYLITGRWFRAPKLEGPWTYAGDDLPADFKKIPEHSEAADVLASVPGTPECEDAILLAQVPVSAVVKRTEAESQVKVEYNGEPQFAPIEGTALSYATNTSADVIRVEDKYYLCANAVWFVSSSPTGPWKICTEVPKEIYAIPPSSPVYHVTYVKVDGSTEDEVTCSYTSGYYGAYVAGVATGVALVWGTGYYYPPYVYTGTVPIYRPYYATYGVAAAYYPNAGVYAVGGYAYGPYASAGRAAWYNPTTGGYGRVYTQQTPYGGHTSAWGYNPRTDTAWNTQQGHNYYAQWGKSTVTRGGETYQAGHVVTQYGSTAVAKGPNNLYAAHDGNVYKRDDNGNWSKYENGQWQPVNPPTNNRSNQNQSGNLSQQNQQRNQQNREEGNQAQNNSARANQSAKQGNQQAQAKRSPGNAQKKSSDELTNSLNREAAARQRGSERVNQQQRWQQRANRGSGWETSRGSRNWGGRGR